MKFKVSLLGTEVFSVELCREDLTAADVAEIVSAAAASAADEEPEQPQHLIAGQFERDHAPRFPEERYGDDDKWVDRPFGFGGTM